MNGEEASGRCNCFTFFADSYAFMLPNASGIRDCKPLRVPLFARSSLVLIAFALAGSLGTAVAQYVPQPPPSYSYPASPQRYPSAHDYGDADSYPPPVSYSHPPYDAEAPDDYPPPASYPYAAGPPRYLGRFPSSVPPSQDSGTAVAALPPEYQPERGPIELSPRFYRTVVDYPTVEQPGTIIIDTPNTYLYLVLGDGKALRYGIGVGREGFTWSGTERISRMKEWPDWLPPPEMIKRQPYLPRFMAGGATNPLGARAMYLGNTAYRIHGTNQPSTIGSFVSSGCIRLTNEDVEDLYSRVTVGTTVIVLPGANTTASQLRSK
jgi:lipoprotein-anchoring transpeptidase ErfK/SrfK